MSVKVLLYGTGLMTQKYLEQDCVDNIIGFDETKPKAEFFPKKTVYAVDNISIEYD